ncbi:MAG: RluA family pseudouridine synthase [Planctomycetia bacterium]|nr:RluA family pseudouridine synthase [Planctomycetia bacterium]
MSLVVLYEDNHCLAVAKPAGLLTQGVPAGIPTLEAEARSYLKTKYHKEGNVYLGIPHRLDRPVSGVVLFARSSKAAARLAEQFRDRTVSKVYVGLVEYSGTPPAMEGQWADHLRKIQSESRTEVVAAEHPEGKVSALHFRRMSSDERFALLRLEPLTGRMHQIRVQAASRGWPIAGDIQYGAVTPFGPPVELSRDRIIALHGWQLTFRHPIRYEPVTIQAPLPSIWGDWSKVPLE